MAACYVPMQDEYHILFVNPVSGFITGYYRHMAGNPWRSLHQAQWGSTDGGLASVAWRDQLRLIYMNGGKVAMNAHDGSNWLDMEYL
jgi:hypothetical protein